MSYTSQVPVADAHGQALGRYFERGGRWFAIHASSSVRDFEVLLETRWGGEAMSQPFPDAVRPLMCRHRVGNGGVLCLALGHCNRPFDAPRPGMPDAPDRRGPWPMPLCQELVGRGIDWAAGRRPL